MEKASTSNPSIITILIWAHGGELPLDEFKDNDVRIVYLAGGVGSVFLGEYHELSKIDKLFDDDVNKVGRFAPGSGKPVQALTSIPKKEDSVALILAWQHSERLIQRLREVGYPGRILTPLPNPRLFS